MLVEVIPKFACTFLLQQTFLDNYSISYWLEQALTSNASFGVNESQKIMSHLTRHEKTALIFLLSITLLGLGASYYKKVTQRITVHSAPFEIYKSHSQQVININTSPLESLTTLPGIGPHLAEEIIEYRTTHGPFERIEDVTKVKGIGQKKFDTLKKFIVLE